MRETCVRLLSAFIPDKARRKEFRKRYMHSSAERHLLDIGRQLDDLGRSVENLRSLLESNMDICSFRPEHGLTRIIQKIELEIFREIVRVCRDNGITYWLSFGTLMGALRHKGFIPWDDDIDIAMLSDDYVRFLEIAPRELNPDICRLIALPNQIARVCHAKFMPRECDLVDWMQLRLHGVIAPAVDLYPHYRCPPPNDDDIAFYRDLQLRKRMMTDAVQNVSDYEAETPLLEQWRKRFMRKDGPYFLLGLEENSRLKPFYRKYDEVFPLKEVAFEGERHPAPRNADYYLICQYGDYYTFPADMHKHVDLRQLPDLELRKLLAFSRFE